MKQLVTDFASGQALLVDAPVPKPGRNQILIRSRVSLISTGTERMLVEFGRSSLIQKARSQPARVKQVIVKARTDGIRTTLDAVRAKLSEPMPLGYCNVGVVEAVGQGVTEFKPGDRVVSNGPHAEFFTVGKNLCAVVPDQVDDETAAATVAAAIGLQGVRLADPTLGECAVVIGAGLIGLLTIQVLLATGCRVLAIDLNQDRLAIARTFGAETFCAAGNSDPLPHAMNFSRGRGADIAIVTTATASDLPIQQAAHMCRRNGRIILVGIAGLNINREDFYKKELLFRVSCSYGPGRHDQNYEENGNDYPIGYVRWTEQRNFEAVLDLMSTRKMQVCSLVSAMHPFDAAPKAYETLVTDKQSLAILLKYEAKNADAKQTSIQFPKPAILPEVLGNGNRIAVIGAGNYASRMLIPAFKKAGAHLGTIASAGGLRAALVGGKAGFEAATTDTDALIADATHTAVIIATRHNSHASLTAKAIAAGKHVFVEKPLALNREDISAVEQALQIAHQNGKNPVLTVGFNRRFSPFTQRLKSWSDKISGPIAIVATMNAGAIPADSWVHDKDEGGRIIGEACHFIDLLRYIAGSPIASFEASAMLGSHAAESLRDTATITLRFENGSIGTIHYFANGAATFPKERIEVFAGGSIAVIDNFRRLVGYGPGTPSHRSFAQNKGQEECAQAFLDAIAGKRETPIPLQELLEVSRVVVTISEQLESQ